MEALTFKVTDFEGPLDLLLALISKNKMNIYDIEIVSLIDQYMAVVNSHGAGMEVASDFIEMAARLIHMKSVFLLPKTEEQERLKQELTGQLIEYSVCKVIAGKLKAMADGVFLFVRQPLEIELDNTYALQHNPQELLNAYSALAGKKAAKKQPRQEQFEELVQKPFVSVTGPIVFVLRNNIGGKINKLAEMFHKSGSRSESVATFLAVLELIRAGRITIDENEEFTVRKKLHAGRVNDGPKTL
ncbi:MAG: segregation/condensation protein A [Oscillospiraceae bacterium]|nr:segregation/condensation protein A [Oscillospiraceae bacterium]